MNRLILEAYNVNKAVCNISFTFLQQVCECIPENRLLFYQGASRGFIRLYVNKDVYVFAIDFKKARNTVTNIKKRYKYLLKCYRANSRQSQQKQLKTLLGTFEG